MRAAEGALVGLVDTVGVDAVNDDDDDWLDTSGLDGFMLGSIELLSDRPIPNLPPPRPIGFDLTPRKETRRAPRRRSAPPARGPTEDATAASQTRR